MTKKSTTAPATEEADVKVCGCGCGVPINPQRSYRPGHDARHRGILLRAHDRGDKDATALLLAKGWKSQLELDKRDEKAAKKAIKKSETKAAVSSGSVRSDVVSSTAEEGVL